MIRLPLPALPLALALLGTAGLLAGCRTTAPAAETQLRHQSEQTRVAPAADIAADLRALPADAGEADYVRFAVLHHPAVFAAHADWRAAIEDVVPARSLPDPQFTFQADIADTLMSFMPGLMADLMGPGKRAAMGREAIAGAEVARRAYVAAVLQVAAEARKAWVELAYVEDVDRLYAATIHTAEQAIDLENAAYATGAGMGTFEKQLRLETLLAEHHAHHAGIADRRVAARARLKSALGLTPGDPDPAWPRPTLVVSPIPTADELWQRAAAANADLARMRAMVEMTVASVDVARRNGTPNFAAGAMLDLKANPLMVRPTATISLPIWRDKLAAQIAAAEARHDAAAARVSVERLSLAAELAQSLYMVREADRMIGYIERTALPNIERAYATLEAGVQSGLTPTADLAEAHLMSLDYRHERLELLRQREDAAVDLALLTAAVAPADAPLPSEVAR